MPPIGAAAPADDGFALGYITYLAIDYRMKLIYRVAMLKLMHEQSCDDGEGVQGAHEPQGQVASVPCFGPVSQPASRAAPTGAGLRPFPVFILWLTGKPPAPGCARSAVFLLLFTGAGGWTARWGPLQGPPAAARAIPARAGTGRPHRRSRRVRSRRWPPPCGRRGRACGRRAPPDDYWASPSPRRGEARAQSPIRRDAG